MHPTLFVSHGAPNIILGNSLSKRNIQRLSKTLEAAQYIIIFSAHYVTKDLKIIHPLANKIMYDFVGFEDDLYKVQYEIKSNEALTENLIQKLDKKQIDITIDVNRKSYDHGVWNVLSMLYEKLDIPVLQLSIPHSYSIEQLIHLGEALQEFKNDALIICSGGVTHNLMEMSLAKAPKKYATQFNDDVIDMIEKGNKSALADILKHHYFKKNHPTSEHFLPLFIAFGNAVNKKGVSFNSEMVYSNISMESFIFDGKDKKC